MLQYKDDAEMAFRRNQAWYRCEIIDRCCFHVTAPRKGVTRRTVPPPASLEDRWTNMEGILDRFEAGAEATFYGGEAIPLLMPNLGPSIMSAWMGCPLQFAESTSWVDPIIHDPSQYAALRFDRGNRWWKWMTEMTRLCAQRGKGKFITGITDMHGGGDALAALRGTEALCMDLATDPDLVKGAERYIRRMWFEVTEELYQLAASEGQTGSGGFLGWGPGRTWPLQDDLLALISPAMSREFLLETIVEQARCLDASVFHLDGPESLPHLDLLLDIPELNGIQWQPGYAHREMLQWIPLIRKILSRGKCVHLTVTPAEVEPLLRALPARGLKLCTSCATEDEARALLKSVAAWTQG